jgi:hypothetical protein
VHHVEQRGDFLDFVQDDRRPAGIAADDFPQPLGAGKE